MKKSLLLLFAVLFLININGRAQEQVIFYPDFRYDNNRGFTKQTVLFEGTEKNNIWYRVSTLPDASLLGYTREGDQKSLKVVATPATVAPNPPETKFYATETYAVVDAIDLSAFTSVYDLQMTFFSLNQFGRGDVSKMEVVLSTDYAGDVTTATWTDVTGLLDQIATGGADWVKSTLSLNDYAGEGAVTIAFKYTCSKTAEISDIEQSATWNIAEVRFTASPIQFETKTSWQFDDATSFEMINIVSTNGQGWKQVNALRPGLDNSNYKSLQMSAVYDDGGTKYVSPTESWAVLNAADYSGYSKLYLFFWNISQYKLGGDSDLSIKMSTNYIKNENDQAGAISSATWTDITSSFNLDKAIGYDSEWIWSIGEIPVDQLNPNMTIAFVYKSTDTGVADNTNRAATWRIGDVKIGGEQIPNSIGDKSNLPVQYFFPNPVSNSLNLSNEVAWVELYNINGSKVKSKANSSNNMDVSQLSPGIYILKLSLKDGSNVTTKLIKR
ncbi:DUF5017 domain-containing protein [Carboxylicivirga sediminis]|uniref:DUF5017 domain-containing protein n=1 Tax=Carboxylicivirga sediminis TaxID=2006564 RepID=A0A941J0F7_9BACT|nr:DUF5017 domain-containing protein [Carboxylicivirga sediminis]MBR8538138.1 DUF5017 domain-containing protein [Carboxylicivirga sediminis]